MMSHSKRPLGMVITRGELKEELRIYRGMRNDPKMQHVDWRAKMGELLKRAGLLDAERKPLTLFEYIDDVMEEIEREDKDERGE